MGRPLGSKDKKPRNGSGKYSKTEEHRRKISNTMKNVRKSVPSWNKGKKIGDVSRFYGIHRSAVNKAFARIEAEIPELEKQGFRCIPMTHVFPDIIAIKDNKVYAIEVEYNDPNYAKYTDAIKNRFDDIIWILRKFNKLIT